MKGSDLIVEFLISKKVSDVFGYPGGMVTHLMDSLSKREDEIKTHINYHEQACSFAACGYAQAKGDIGVAFATSGPGATNLITGICNAYFDSIPTLFITGQVNTFEKNSPGLGRQKGFQETNIVDIVKNVTKYVSYVDDVNNLEYELEKAYYIATSDRPGPVLLDIPMNVFRSIIDSKNVNKFTTVEKSNSCVNIKPILNALNNCQRPCIIIGNGIKSNKKQFLELAEKLNIPIVYSMLAVDVLPFDNANNFGFIGAYGDRTANFIVAKSDLIISLGTRLDIRQVGAKKENFAPNATVIRVDIDEGELKNKIKDNQVIIKSEIGSVLMELLRNDLSFLKHRFDDWQAVCNTIKSRLKDYDKNAISNLVKQISVVAPDDCIITTDVGQNQVWIAQYFRFKANQLALFSGGHGAMGYSLPAAIGAYYAKKKPVISFSGDGGIQMNIQELQYLKNSKIPVNVVVFNNHALGMIRHFQEMYFNKNYAFTTKDGGYSTPNFKLIAKAYDLEYKRLSLNSRIPSDLFSGNNKLIEVSIDEDTYVFPKLEYGKPNQDQEPLIDRELYNELMGL